MKVLVTGATGNVGSRLARRLLALGHEITILCRATSDRSVLQGVTFREVVGDITDPSAVRAAAAGQEVVFHVAALISYRRRDHARMHDANVGGTRNVVEACLAGRVRRLVHTSSVAAVGIPRGAVPADEQCGFSAEARKIGYFRTKWEAEQEVWAGVARGLDAVAVNPGVIWGRGVSGSNSARFLRQVAEGRLPGVPGGGVTVVDLEDVIDGHLLALERGRRGHRYILGSAMLAWRVIVDAVCAWVGRSPPSIGLPSAVLMTAGYFGEGAADLFGFRPPMLTRDAARCAFRNLFYDSAKARRELGFTPRPFAETLGATLEGLGFQGGLQEPTQIPSATRRSTWIS